MNKNILNLILVLFNSLISIIVIYIIWSYVYSIFNSQICAVKYDKNDSCEVQAQKQVEGCKFVFLKWKKLDYNTELQMCKEYLKN